MIAFVRVARHVCAIRTLTERALPKTLILGTSHVRAIAAALTPDEALQVQSVNLRDAPTAFDQKGNRFRGVEGIWPDPDLVLLTLAGNFHNIFCLMENSARFRLGEPSFGSIPEAAPDRPFVPRDLLRAHFDQRLDRVWAMQRAVHAAFPAARFALLSAPPPVIALPELTEAERAAGGQKVMFQFLAFDAAPAPLRLAIWGLQQELCREQAALLGADFIEPPAAALDPQGFLAAGYWTDDPTHGNAAYGRLVLEQISALAGAGLGAAA